MFTFEQLKTSNGITRTKSLFYELSYHDPEYAIFTTKEKDIKVNGRTMVSLQQLYIAMVPNDPTEYEFAQAVFGSWDVWEKIKKAPQLSVFIKKWQNEVEVKVKSQAIQAIAMEMKEGGRSSFSAAKLLLEKGWLDKDNASQAKKKLQQKEQHDQDKQALALLSEDADRLGIKIQ